MNHSDARAGGSVPSHIAVARRTFISGAAATGVTLLIGTPAIARTDPPVAGHGPDVATGWIRTLYDVVMAEGLTPPAAARLYYYSSLAMYESAVWGMPGFRSLAGQVADLRPVPWPRNRSDWPSAVSASVSAVALSLLPNATAASVQSIVDRREAVLAERRATVLPRFVDQAVVHGNNVAAHLVAWIATDGYAEASTTPYVPPAGTDKWRPTPPNFGTAIDPHWQLVRPAMLRSADEVVPEPHVPFSTEPGSLFHGQAMTTYRQSSMNTDDQIAIARFWTDNPLLSGLPSGHWFLVAADLIESHLGYRLDRTLEAFVRLGVALHDAFLNCWTWKYRHNLIRPVSYIQDHIDPAWATLVNTPQFPEYTSGHSVGSAAADVVLTKTLGTFPFVDSTGLSRGLPARDFTSIHHAADEAAKSRLYGGIHYLMGIDNGVAQGRQIGKLVNRRLRTRRWPPDLRR